MLKTPSIPDRVQTADRFKSTPHLPASETAALESASSPNQDIFRGNTRKTFGGRVQKAHTSRVRDYTPKTPTDAQLIRGEGLRPNTIPHPVSFPQVSRVFEWYAGGPSAPPDRAPEAPGHPPWRAPPPLPSKHLQWPQINTAFGRPQPLEFPPPLISPPVIAVGRVSMQASEHAPSFRATQDPGDPGRVSP